MKCLDEREAHFELTAGLFFVILRRAVGDRGIEDMVEALKAAGVKER